MEKFNDWFRNKLTIGAYPDEIFLPARFAYIINVSDRYDPTIDIRNATEGGAKTFWFPMNESRRDVGLNSIYGAMVILSIAEKRNSTVYLHCRSGKNRSRAVAAAYYYMRVGKQWVDSFNKERNGYDNSLLAMCGRGSLLPLTKVEEFIEFTSIELNGETPDFIAYIKQNTINNF